MSQLHNGPLHLPTGKKRAKGGFLLNIRHLTTFLLKFIALWAGRAAKSGHFFSSFNAGLWAQDLLFSNKYSGVF
jgi:hypothetical protein